MPRAREPRLEARRDGAVRIEATAIPREVSRIRRAVVAAAEAHGIGPGLRLDIGLAVSEACANVINHAYVQAAAPGPLIVETYEDGHEFVVIVSDEGSGIAPRADSPGLGLGLALIARLTHRMEIGSNGRGGSRVTMAFAAAA